MVMELPVISMVPWAKADACIPACALALKLTVPIGVLSDAEPLKPTPAVNSALTDASLLVRKLSCSDDKTPGGSDPTALGEINASAKLLK